jgi:FMN phosphatase YigB (HAD superfamily)
MLYIFCYFTSLQRKPDMELLKGIKNIIFDFGGVIINIDYKLTINEFKSLGLTDIEKVYTQFSQLPWFNKFDTGGIGSETFLTEFSKMLAPGTNREQIIHAWNAMLLDFPAERAELLLNLRSSYRTFLLSNTNEIHINYFLNRISEWYGNEAMDKFFEKVYYSNRIGMRKPDKEIFEFVLMENSLKASQTLFIDDSIQHVEGARIAGLRAYHLQAPETIVDILK